MDDFDNQLAELAKKYGKQPANPPTFAILSLALLMVVFGLTAIIQAEKNRTLAQENALLKTTLQQQSEPAPTSPARLDIPPLPPTYSEYSKFNGWTVCEENCGIGSI